MIELLFEMHELYIRVLKFLKMPEFYLKMHTLPQNFRIVPKSTQIICQNIPLSLVYLFVTILYCSHDAISLPEFHVISGCNSIGT